MKINPDVFEAYLRCPTKCWLRSTGEPSACNSYPEWVRTQNDSYRTTGMERLLADSPKDEIELSPDMENVKDAKWRLAFSLAVQAQIDSCVLESELHAVERVAAEGQGKPAQIIPVRFLFTDKPYWHDKLLLVFDALVLSEVLGCDVSYGKIVHGDDHATRTVHTSAVAGKVRKIIEKIATLLASHTPPDLVLNRHCVECEFRDRCRQKAIEQDDLSLLSKMTERERRKLNSKGVFTVKQLSYTFRARRRPKRLAGKREKYHHSLKALAIRERKIHIVGRPKLELEGTPVYLDVEGIPDRNFYYLVGLRVKAAEQVTQHSLWADSVDEEKRIWTDFLKILSGIQHPVLVHYGSYETTFLKRMCSRYGEPVKDSPLAKIIKSAVNLLSSIFAQIYFPTYSNSLKDIVSSLGFVWSNLNLSGPNSITCRLQWERSADLSLKQRLFTYNSEDCNGIEILTSFLYKLCNGESSAKSHPAIDAIHVDQMKPVPPFLLIDKDGAALPEFKAINRAAYWDYQRQRVYVRSSKVIKKACQKTPNRKGKRLHVKHAVEFPALPLSCTTCGGATLWKRGTTDVLVHDIRFMQSGVKGWVTRHICENWYCAKCQRLVRPPGTSEFAFRKYGLHLRAFAAYQLIQLRISGITVAKSLNQLFDFDVTGSNISTFKSDFATLYTKTVAELIERISRGSLVHADETKARMIGKSGFVWVLASLEDVVFLYSDTRDGDMVHAVLKDFRGVLVSDFYAVYDAFKCPQQKCLIHLMRDINDDMHRHPYDEELREIAQKYAAVLRIIVETVDRHGLKAHFLAKHLPAVEELFTWIATADFASEIAQSYRKRFHKSREKLFTFLTHDGVPWNNNNAENAVRAFAALRTIISGATTEKGLREYLLLLSICETCKRRGISFLDFLISGESSVELFAAAKSRYSRRNPRRQQANTSLLKADTPDDEAEASTPEWSGSQVGSRNPSTIHDDRALAKDEPEAWSQFVIPSNISQRAELIHTQSRLERFAGVPIGGTMVAVPALNKSGLWSDVEKLFPAPIDKHFQQIALTFIALLPLSRFPSIEALQFVAPVEWRKIFCRERLPANRALDEVIQLIGKNAGRVASWKGALAARWIKETLYLDEKSFTGGTSLEVTADRFHKYQRNNVTLDRFYEDILDLTRETLEPGRWPVSGGERSEGGAMCTLAEKNHSVGTGYAQGDEMANRVDDSRLVRASYVESGTTKFLSTIKLIAFRAENMMIGILLEHVPDYEHANSILRDIFRGPADLVPNFEQRTLTVWLNQLAVRRYNEALRHLYTELTATGTSFPGTDLRLIYDIRGAA